MSLSHSFPFISTDTSIVDVVDKCRTYCAAFGLSVSPVIQSFCFIFLILDPCRWLSCCTFCSCLIVARFFDFIFSLLSFTSLPVSLCPYQFIVALGFYAMHPPVAIVLALFVCKCVCTRIDSLHSVCPSAAFHLFSSLTVSINPSVSVAFVSVNVSVSVHVVT